MVRTDAAELFHKSSASENIQQPAKSLPEIEAFGFVPSSISIF